MGRPRTIDNRYSTMITFDKDELEAFEKLVGKGNVSNELRAFIKDRIRLEKNEQARTIDPLNLTGCLKKPYNNNTRQSKLFEDFATKDRRPDISKYVDSIKDKQTLDRVWLNSKVLYNVVDTKRKRMAITGIKP